jgi:N-alpha-acetyltransferase 40
MMAKRRLSKFLSTEPGQSRQYDDQELLSSDEHISALNSLSSLEFKQKYISHDNLHPSMAENTTNGARIDITFTTSSELAPEDLTACFNLIATTSQSHYEESSFGWNPRRKKREMKEDEMRYLLVHSPPPEANDSAGIESQISGFLSFMLTHDSTPSVPVLYVYEIHLLPHLRKMGLGAHLMHVAEAIAEKVGMEKVMLTCFVANERAYDFYRRRGYGRDVCSPEDRRIRRKLVRVDYVIMSRGVGG